MSYRRDDASGHAGRLFDELTELGRYDVFMDIEKIDPGPPVQGGDRQRARLLRRLPRAHRAPMAGRDGLRRPRSAREPQAPRASGNRARPRPGGRAGGSVLLQAVEMPAPEALPEPLQGLTERNAHELSDTRWHYDVEQLVKALDAIAAKKAELENARRQEDERTRREREAAGAAEREAFQEQENARRQEEERRRRDREAAEAAARRGAEGEAAERAERDRGGGRAVTPSQASPGSRRRSCRRSRRRGRRHVLSGGDGQDTQDTPPQAASANRAYVRTIDAMLMTPREREATLVPSSTGSTTSAPLRTGGGRDRHDHGPAALAPYGC